MNNLYGLKQTDWDKIISVLKEESAIEEAILFGSRAKGNYKPGSDVDIVLKGTDSLQQNVSHVSYLLNEESLMPYKFDLFDFKNITNVDLISHIERVGIVVYRKTGITKRLPSKNV